MIRLEHFSKRYGSKVLFDELTYHFPAGERIALVGANGVGKTTLLKMIAGEEDRDNGVIICPNQFSIGYLRQTPNPQPKETVLEECESGAERLHGLKKAMDAASQKLQNGSDPKVIAAFEEAETAWRLNGGYTLSSRAQRILIGLGFKENEFDRHPRELSGGWLMRLELSKILLNSPDFLILDEPTNHLDLPSMMWVEKFLLNFRGTLLFVSHDRALLNRLATLTLHLQGGKLTPYKGNFDQFIDAREKKIDQDASRLEGLRQRQESIERFVTRFGAKATKARQAQSRLKMLARLRQLEAEIAPDVEEDYPVFRLEESQTSGRDIFTVKDGAIGYDAPLIQKLDFSLFRGNVVAIIGPNGVGKSTLLKTMAGAIRPLDGNFAWGHNVRPVFLSQDQRDLLREDETVIQCFMRLIVDAGEKNARAALGGFLFRGDEVFKPVRILSGGERARLGMAVLFFQKPNVILLDEPTSHLDMASVEALVRAIEEFSGSVIFVSHDRTFIDSICTHVLALVDRSKFLLASGKLADYERIAKGAGFPDILDPEFSLDDDGDQTVGETKSRNRENREQAKDFQRRERRVAKDLEKTEAEIESCRKSIHDVEERMSKQNAEDYAAMGELGKEHKLVKLRLEELEEKWISLSEQLEDMRRT